MKKILRISSHLVCRHGKKLQSEAKGSPVCRVQHPAKFEQSDGIELMVRLQLRSPSINIAWANHIWCHSQHASRQWLGGVIGIKACGKEWNSTWSCLRTHQTRVMFCNLRFQPLLQCRTAARKVDHKAPEFRPLVDVATRKQCVTIHVLSIYASIPLSVYPSIHLSIYPSMPPSIYPSIYPSINLSIHPSIHLSIVSIRLSVY